MFHRRSIFLINKGFQLRFAFYVCSWLIALCLAYPLLIFNLFDYFMRYLVLDPLGPAVATLEKTRVELLWLLALMQIVILSLTFLISIFMSHRIAGPLYKLRQFLAKAKDGDLSQVLSFRKGDYFQELAKDYNELVESFRLKLEEKTDQISAPIPKLEKALAQANPEIRADLEEVLNCLKEANKK
jgi:sensor histidine kinase YesM